MNLYSYKILMIKVSLKYIMFQKTFYMFKTFKITMWIGPYFFSKVLFPYQTSTIHAQFF
jgi:hypothetical protein